MQRTTSNALRTRLRERKIAYVKIARSNRDGLGGVVTVAQATGIIVSAELDWQGRRKREPASDSGKLSTVRGRFLSILDVTTEVHFLPGDMPIT